jgi:tetratricopeptide (TPR) repeat protein
MPLNAVERRLLDIREAWTAFTSDPGKRLLVWEMPSSSYRLAECFFEAQKFEVEYATQDLCIVFKEPFEHSIQYARALKLILAGSYATSRADIESEGIPADWAFSADEFPDSAYGFVQAVRSFGARHHRHFKHLAAILMPTEVSDDAAFASWFGRALAAQPPERLRIAVLDPAEAPRLVSLSGDADPSIRHERLALDALAVARETFAQERVVGPAGTFRDMLVALMSLVEHGPADDVRRKAADAYAFAGGQGWSDQQAVVAMLVAGAQLKEQRHDEAIATYRIAEGDSKRAAEAGNPAARKVAIHAKLGEAGAHLAAGRPADAAYGYDQAAALAQAIPDLIIAVEALRMAAFCHARMEDRDGAIARGREALQIGNRLRPEVRNMTSLPIAATDLMHVVDPRRAEQMEAVRGGAEKQGASLLAQAEARAAGLERTTERAAFDAVERDLAVADAAAWHEAEALVQDLVAGGGADFRRDFGTARALLGVAWPLGVGAAEALAFAADAPGASP